MKVLVSGANGMLGANLVRVLLSRGFEVRAFVREGSNLSVLEGTGCELFKGQITDPDDVLRGVEGCRYVIHAAAKTSQSHSDWRYFEKENIESTRHFIEACKFHKAERFVFISTANCFGNGSKSSPGDETRPFMPWLKNSGYAFSKKIAQDMVLGEVQKNGFPAIVANPAFILGPYDAKPSSGKIFSYILGKRIVFCPPGGKSFADVQNIAEGIVSAIQNGRIGQCYLLPGENLSYNEFFRKALQITGKKAFIFILPRWLLLLMGSIGSFAEKILKIPVSLNQANARMLCEGNYYSAKKAETELNYKPTNICTTIGTALGWLKSNHYFNF